LPNPQGIEGLRTIAARYRLRYLVVCSTDWVDTSHLNNWAWLYATGIGVLAAPGYTVSSRGMVQASLFDVKTGTVLFTAGEPVETSRRTWLIGSAREQDTAERDATTEAARRLAGHFLTRTEQLVAWVGKKGPMRGEATSMRER
jgi:hypothetical protein